LDPLRVKVSSCSKEAHGEFAISLDPFGMLDPQIVVNLLPKLGVGLTNFINGFAFGIEASLFICLLLTRKGRTPYLVRCVAEIAIGGPFAS